MLRFFIIMIFVSSLGFSQDINVIEIIKKVDENEKYNSTKSEASQIITTSGGSKRTLSMKVYTKDRNDKQLTVYTGPARVKGDKILMLEDGDEIWFYTPKTDRVRHLASHAKRQSVQGSDFSYEDMASGNLEDDYTHKLIGEEEFNDSECYKIESVPTESGPSYSKVIIWVEKERYLTYRIDYHENDILLKRLICSDYEKLEDKWYPKKLFMKNLQDGGETIIKTNKIEINIDLSDKLFTTNYLKRR